MLAKKAEKELKAERYAVFGAKPWHALPNHNEIQYLDGFYKITSQIYFTPPIDKNGVRHTYNSDYI